MATLDPLSTFPISRYPIAFLDYLWVIILYISSAFFLATTIDGRILPPLNVEKTKQLNSLILFIFIIIQFAFQGFIAIVIFILLQKLPSPVNGIFGYNHHSAVGLIVRNPAIISVMLFALSKSLQGRLTILYSRFNQNALPYVQQIENLYKNN